MSKLRQSFVTMLDLCTALDRLLEMKIVIGSSKDEQKYCYQN